MKPVLATDQDARRAFYVVLGIKYVHPLKYAERTALKFRVFEKAHLFLSAS